MLKIITFRLALIVISLFLFFTFCFNKNPFNKNIASNIGSRGSSNNSGSLDTSFGNKGFVTFNYSRWQPFNSDDPEAIAVDSKGYIYVSGYTTSGGDVLLKYTPNGQLDTSFNSTGYTIIDIPGYDSVDTIAIDSKGYIYLAGNINLKGSDYSIFLLKYTPNGQLDTSFNSTGYTIFRHPFFDSSEATAITIDSKGCIYVAGSIGNNLKHPKGDIDSSNILLLKYTPNGQLDTSFNSTGYTIFNYPKSTGKDKASELTKNVANTITIDSKGCIYVAGYTFYYTDSHDTIQDIILLKYAPNGQLDTSFNSTGYITFNHPTFNSYDVANAIALDSKGYIYLAGYTNTDIILLKYTPNGQLDTSFNSTGYITFNHPTFNSYDVANAISLFGNYIYVGGFTFNPVNDANSTLLLRFFK